MVMREKTRDRIMLSNACKKGLLNYNILLEDVRLEIIYYNAMIKSYHKLEAMNDVVLSLHRMKVYTFC